MRLMWAALTIIAAAVTAAAPAAGRLEGQPYDGARTTILRLGWKPVAGSCGGASVQPGDCRRYPELRSCTGVGEGLCTMQFTRKARCLVITTTGDVPGNPDNDTRVRNVGFPRGRCPAN